jgi:predicted ribosome quality control (RQC) complex YloA/Tae2 family protein
MKTINIYFPEFKKEISYLIGQNARDNFAVIDEGVEDDIWFHAKDDSSCHIICILPNDLNLSCNEKNLLILKGAELCKFHTHKLISLYKVPILYTEIKNITKSKTPGLVNVKNYNTIVLTNNSIPNKSNKS